MDIYLLNPDTEKLASSPCQKIRTVQQLTLYEGHSYLDDIFIDDIVNVAPSLSIAQDLMAELVLLIALGGFHLCK
ncbi:hypothetical protein PR048_002997 [Dryococelus australis]|uniref:Uncharacterized protein n=1 Tax=Dryococelus australis TaxID=614101 RepID=A0ABQ9ILR0_9NEOP|nr:hypothetical protein PR048_002997 [Dryococelus australis]